MSTSHAGRVLAVCDLLVDGRGHLDADRVVRTAAEQVARLTRSELGIVVARGPKGLVVGTYPRAVPDPQIHALLDDVEADAPTEERWPPSDGDVRRAEFGGSGPYRGAVAALGPVDEGFSYLDEWLVMVVARRVEAQLELVELHRQRTAAAEIVRDAALAGELQRVLMPPPAVRIGRFDIAGLLHPARHVGGDVCGVFAVGGEVAAIVADVSGKGLPASLLTAAVHAAAGRAVAAEGPNPSAILAAIDEELSQLLDRTGRIVTAAAAATDVAAGALRVASAGHSPIVARSGGVARLIRPESPPLGVGRYDVAEEFLPVERDDLLLLASDGVIDQRCPDGEAFGTDRLLTAVTSLRPGGALGIVEAVFADVVTFAAGATQDDDQTGVALWVTGDSA